MLNKSRTLILDEHGMADFWMNYTKGLCCRFSSAGTLVRKILRLPKGGNISMHILYKLTQTLGAEKRVSLDSLIFIIEVDDTKWVCPKSQTCRNWKRDEHD